MEYLSDRIEDWRTAANDNKAPEQTEVSQHIAEILTRAKTRAETALGRIINPEIAALDTGALGDCHSQSGRIRIDDDLAPEKPQGKKDETGFNTSNENQITHVLIHEGTHRKRFSASQNYLPEATEEGLTELATEKYTGGTIAYADYISDTRVMARRVGLPIGTLVSDYETGNIERINAALAADANGMTFAEYQKLIAANDDESFALAA